MVGLARLFAGRIPGAGEDPDDISLNEPGIAADPDDNDDVSTVAAGEDLGDISLNEPGIEADSDCDEVCANKEQARKTDEDDDIIVIESDDEDESVTIEGEGCRSDPEDPGPNKPLVL